VKFVVRCNLGELHRVLVEKFDAPKAVAAGVMSQLRDQTVVPSPGAPSTIRVREPDDA
jgi:hypothetical protein